MIVVIAIVTPSMAVAIAVVVVVTVTMAVSSGQVDDLQSIKFWCGPSWIQHIEASETPGQ